MLPKENRTSRYRGSSKNKNRTPSGIGAQRYACSGNENNTIRCGYNVQRNAERLYRHGLSQGKYVSIKPLDESKMERPKEEINLDEKCENLTHRREKAAVRMLSEHFRTQKQLCQESGILFGLLAACGVPSSGSWNNDIAPFMPGLNGINNAIDLSAENLKIRIWKTLSELMSTHLERIVRERRLTEWHICDITPLCDALNIRFDTFLAATEKEVKEPKSWHGDTP